MLVTPFYVEGRPVRTLWVIAHDPTRKFDTEDLRLIDSLGLLAAAVYPILAAGGGKTLLTRVSSRLSAIR
jgi:hypothetical protein